MLHYMEVCAMEHLGSAILVPLDGSKNAENAIPAAASLQALYGGEMKLLHVTEHRPKTREEGERATATFSDYAAEVAGQLGAGAHTAELLFDVLPARAILDAASDARFIVIASHGRGGFRASVLGSVADKVVRGSRIPVLVVPGLGHVGPAFATRSIMVALDGSQAAEAGLEIGRDIARRAEAGVVLVRAYRHTGLPAPGFSLHPSDDQDAEEAEAKQYLASVARDGERQLALYGHAADVVVDAAGQIGSDIVVMATEGKGAASRLALGSTTDRVMHRLHRPLLIVPVGRA